LKIDITEVQRDTGASLEFEGELTLKDVQWQGEPISFPGPLHVDGRITNVGEMLVMNASVKGTAILMCRLCMGDFEYDLDFGFEAKLKDIPEQEDPDYFAYQGYQIDLTDIVMEFLILEIPSVRQCREDCKGLCPMCGVNLNEKSCKCTDAKSSDHTIDERLEALKEYYNGQGKEV